MFSKGVQSAAPAITRMTAGVNPYITAAATAVTIANAIYSNLRSDQSSQLPSANIIGGRPAEAEPVYEQSSLLNPIQQPQTQSQQMTVARPVSLRRRMTGNSGNVTFLTQPLISPGFINQDLQLTNEEAEDLFRAIPRTNRNGMITNVIRNMEENGVGQPRLLDQIIGDYFLAEIFGGVSGSEFSTLDRQDLALLRAVFNNVVLGGLQIGSEAVSLSSTRMQIVQAMQQVINNATVMADLHASVLPPRIIFLILCLKRRKGRKLDQLISKYLAAKQANRNSSPIQTNANPQQMITTMAMHISLATHYHLFENVFAQIGDELGIPREGNDLPTRKLGFHIMMTALSIDSIDNREGLIEQLLHHIRDQSIFNHNDLTRLLEEHGIFIDVMAALGSIGSRLQEDPEGLELMAPQASQEERKSAVSELNEDNLQSRLWWQQNEVSFIFNHLSGRILMIAGAMNGDIPLPYVQQDSAEGQSLFKKIRSLFKRGAEEQKGVETQEMIEELKEPLLGAQDNDEEKKEPLIRAPVDNNQVPPAQRIAENNNPIPAALEIQQEGYQNVYQMIQNQQNLVDFRGQYEERMNRRLRNQFIVNLSGIASLLTPEVIDVIDLIQRILTFVKFKDRHDPDPEDDVGQDKKPKVVIKENLPLDLSPMKFVVKKELELKRRDLEDETPIENIIKNQDDLPPVKPRRGRPRKPIPAPPENSAA